MKWSMGLREGDRVLVPDHDHAYLSAAVVQLTEAGLDVRLVDGSTRTLAVAAAAKVVLADPLALQGGDDMVRFNLLTEASIVHNLRVRYEREAIYTAVGPILISVNPLRQLQGLFGPEVAQRYADAADGAALSALPPHPYAQVEAAYREVLSQGCNQSLVVSGESGAGKTELTKICLRFLVRRAHMGDGAGGAGGAGGAAGGAAGTSGGSGEGGSSVADRRVTCNPEPESCNPIQHSLQPYMMQAGGFQPGARGLRQREHVPQPQQFALRQVAARAAAAERRGALRRAEQPPHARHDRMRPLAAARACGKKLAPAEAHPRARGRPLQAICRRPRGERGEGGERGERDLAPRLEDVQKRGCGGALVPAQGRVFSPLLMNLQARSCSRRRVSPHSCLGSATSTSCTSSPQQRRRRPRWRPPTGHRCRRWPPSCCRLTRPYSSAATIRHGWRKTPRDGTRR